MGERVHAGCSREAHRHRSHHVRVDDGDLRNVVGIHAHELADLLGVGDYIVDRDLGRGACRGGHGDGKGGVILGVRHALERADVRELGVLMDDTDGLGGVHGGSAADGDDAIRAGVRHGSHAILHVLDGWVGLNLRVDHVGEARLVEKVGHLGSDAKLHEVGVGADKGLGEAATAQLARDFLDGPGAVIRDGVEDKPINHRALPSRWVPATPVSPTHDRDLSTQRNGASDC